MRSSNQKDGMDVIFPITDIFKFSGDGKEISFFLASEAIGDFDTFKVVSVGSDRGISAEVGKLSKDSTREGAPTGTQIIQRIIFDARMWNPEDALLWVQTNIKDAVNVDIQELGKRDHKQDSFNRFDIGKFSKVKKTRQGYWKADGFATRTGVFTYRLPNGTLQRELRLSEEVFKPDSMETLKQVPMTNDHPSSGMLDTENTKQFSVGFTGENVRKVDDFLAVGLTITDKEAIDSIKDLGKQELSCGYKCQLEFKPGTFDGVEYDAIQRNITYNHLAIVGKGRAGPNARIRLDSDTGFMDYNENEKPNTQKTGANFMTKITIDNVEYEASEQLASVLTQKLKADTGSLEKVTGERDEFKEKLDTLQGSHDELTEKLKDHNDEDKFRASVKARVDLESKVGDILGEDVKIDEMKDVDIKKAVINKVHPDLKLDEKSEGYIDGRFESVLENYKERTDHTGKLGDGITKVKADGVINDLDKARNSFIESSKDAWQQPLSGTKQPIAVSR